MNKGIEITTILISDICNSSQLFNDHTPQEAANLLKKFYKIGQEVANKFYGTFNEVCGDEILIYFKNADDALSAAIYMRKKLKSFQKQYQQNAKIGIHTGCVYIWNTNLNGKNIQCLTGKATAIAKRIEELGNIDNVVISEDTKLSVRKLPPKLKTLQLEVDDFKWCNQSIKYYKINI